MNIYTFSQKNIKVHFIGIGGVNMSALAKHLRLQGYSVSGSDISANSLSELKNLGITIYNKHSEKNVKDADVVVYTSAISDDNVELVYAKQNGIILLKRSQLLGQIMDKYARSIGVCGSHGKTTTTDMIARMLICANLNPTVFLGGDDNDFGNYHCGNSDIIITEACEYQKNFLDLKPKITVVLNIDNDHLDTYKTIEQTTSAFYEFSKDSISIINFDDERAKSISTLSTISVSEKAVSNFRAKNLVYNGKGYSFTVYSSGRRLGRIHLKVVGKHNVYNALSAVAIGSLMKVPFNVQKIALENFLGVKRRNEYMGKVFGMDIFCDYAHHPNEISAMLLTYSQQKVEFITVFQPHTYSRTKLLKKEFLDCFKDCSPLIIYKTYPAREKYDKNGSAKTLYNELVNNKGLNNKKIYYVDNKKELLGVLSSLSQNVKKAVFLGAGDIYEITKEIVDKD